MGLDGAPIEPRYLRLEARAWRHQDELHADRVDEPGVEDEELVQVRREDHPLGEALLPEDVAGGFEQLHGVALRAALLAAHGGLPAGLEVREHRPRLGLAACELEEDRAHGLRRPAFPEAARGRVSEHRRRERAALAAVAGLDRQRAHQASPRRAASMSRRSRSR
ncbi:hypothetical protein WMF30_07420 [Sorangium sp. So ce134]